jgi:hypothetical protein
MSCAARHLAARHHYQFLARRACQGREHIQRISWCGLIEQLSYWLLTTSTGTAIAPRSASTDDPTPAMGCRHTAILGSRGWWCSASPIGSERLTGTDHGVWNFQSRLLFTCQDGRIRSPIRGAAHSEPRHFPLPGFSIRGDPGPRLSSLSGDPVQSRPSSRLRPILANFEHASGPQPFLRRTRGLRTRSRGSRQRSRSELSYRYRRS